MSKKIPLPKGKYIKSIEVDDGGISIQFAKKKKIALLFISINERYWPYLKQVIEDSKKHFLPQHNVEYFVWTDMPLEDTPEYTARLEQLLPQQALDYSVSNNMRPPDQWWGRETIVDTVNFLRNTKGIHLFETGAVEWPAPTLMRYHLFLQQEEALKDFDYVFYLDADMRVVDKISDEILGKGLTAAPHPGYCIDKRLIPPIEPNQSSTAYIHRLGRIVDDDGKPRFMPFYAAGGFQGGISKLFIEAMKLMKDSIDKDFDRNYTAIWNDESHWNKFLWEFQRERGDITFLDPSYIYPDSLINEYYVPIWGRNYPPKIITLTKPFSLSKQAGQELSQVIGNTQPRFECPTCKDQFDAPGYFIKKVLQCPGVGKPHQLEMVPK